jgi:sulfonate transport system substrate-binding protein
MKRKAVARYLAGAGATLVVALATCILMPASARAQEKFTDWGWPSTYEQVSEKSVAWLKDKGWWPLQAAFQAPWSGQNSINIVMDKQGLTAKRGVNVVWQAFPSGPAMNEVIISGRFQIGNGANFPMTSLIDKNVPAKTIAILSPNNLHAVIVPTNSPLKEFKDLKGSNPAATIGLVTGSSAEFYVRLAALAHDVHIGTDIILKNMPPAEQLLLPHGLSAVVAWEPTASMMIKSRKNGRVIDQIYPYSFFQGNFFVRKELVDNVPDVVQALSDAYAEAVLWIRRYPEQTVDLMLGNPQLKNFPKDVLLGQVEAYNNFYKPTHIYPHAEFWGATMEPIYAWLHEQKRIQKPLKGKDYAGAVEKRFMDRTFAKLGWAIPARPPFIPPGWTGAPDKPPYPEYVTPLNTSVPQAFPEAGDLTKDWQFAGRTYRP